MVSERANMRLFLFGDLVGASGILTALPDGDNYYFWQSHFVHAALSRDYEKVASVSMQDTYYNALVPGWGQIEAARYLW